MFDPGDQGTSDDVRVKEFCIFHWYKELYWPFFGDILHVFVGQLIIGLQFLFTLIPARGDVDKVLICVKLR
jgi:hypothetical protein